MYGRTPLALRAWYAILRWFFFWGFLVADDAELLRLRRWTWRPLREHQRRLSAAWQAGMASGEATMKLSLEHRANQLARGMVESQLAMARAQRAAHAAK